MSVMSQEVDANDNQVNALRLRQAGVPYEEIARLLGYKSASGAFQAVKAGLKKTLREPADELRNMEVSRLDAIQVAIWSNVRKGDLKAIDRYLKVAERRAKLLGLDAKQEIKIEGNLFTGNINKVREKRWKDITKQIAAMSADEAEPGAPDG